MFFYVFLVYNNNMQKKINKNLIAIVLASVSALAFLVCAVLILCDYNFKIDAFNTFVANNRTSGLTAFFKIFTHIGSFYTLAVLAVIGVVLLYFVFKQKRFAIFSGACFACVCIANFIIKQIIRRARPEHLMIIEETGFSFPSGHAMMTFAFFALAIYFVCAFVKNKTLKVILATVFSILIVTVSFSRIYLGVHYLTDILAGWLVTLAIVIVFMLAYQSKLFRKRG